jgi:hypothetical protein
VLDERLVEPLAQRQLERGSDQLQVPPRRCVKTA